MVRLANSFSVLSYIFLVWFCLSMAMPDHKVFFLGYLFGPIMVLLFSYLSGALKIFVTKDTSYLKLALAPGIAMSFLVFTYIGMAVFART